MHKETRTTRKKMNPRFHPMCWQAMMEIGGRKTAEIVSSIFPISASVFSSPRIIHTEPSLT